MAQPRRTRSSAHPYIGVFCPISHAAWLLTAKRRSRGGRSSGQSGIAIGHRVLSPAKVKEVLAAPELAKLHGQLTSPRRAPGRFKLSFNGWSTPLASTVDKVPVCSTLIDPRKGVRPTPLGSIAVLAVRV